MVAFANTDNQSVPVITHENLAEFQQYLLELNNSNEPRVRIDPSLSLSDILTDSEGNKLNLSDTQCKFLTKDLVYSTYNPNWAEELINNAEKYPKLISGAYLAAGNSLSSPLYEGIGKQLSQRNFEDNIPAIHALVMNGCDLLAEEMGKGEITKLSAKNQQYVSDIFNMSSYADKNNKRNVDRDLLYNIDTFVKSASVSKFLNYEQASPKFRAFITKQVLNTFGRVTAEELLNKMNPACYTKEALIEILNEGVKIPDKTIKDTSKATTQAEKNANILPPYYTNIMSAILKVAENENKYDQNHYGQIKSLTRRYQDMCGELAPGAKDKAIFKAGLMMLAQKDIINGDAAKLDADILQSVINNDKDNYYLRKIPENVITEKRLEISPEKTIITKLQNKEKLLENVNVFDAVTHNNLSSQEKQEIIQTAEDKLNKQESLDKELQKRLENYEKDQKVLAEQNLEVSKKSFVADSVNSLQQAFNAIQSNLKNGTPNTQEQFLTREAVEKHISSYLKGSKQELKLPEQKSLPLLIGRKEEQQRRENLDKAIREFNTTLGDIAVNSQRTFKTVFPYQEQYEGIILTDKAKSMSSADKQAALENFALRNRQFNEEYRNIDMTQFKKAAIDRQKESLNKAKEHLSNRKNMFKEMAKERLGINSTEQTATVTPDMTPEQKRKVRSGNRQITDKLAEKSASQKGLSDDKKIQKTVSDIKNKKIQKTLSDMRNSRNR